MVTFTSRQCIRFRYGLKLLAVYLLHAMMFVGLALLVIQLTVALSLEDETSGSKIVLVLYTGGTIGMKWTPEGEYVFN